MIISGFRFCVDVDSTVVGVMAWSGGTRLAEAVSGLGTAVVLGKAVASAAVPPLLSSHQPHCVSPVSGVRGVAAGPVSGDNTQQLEEMASGVIRR